MLDVIDWITVSPSPRRTIIGRRMSSRRLRRRSLVAIASPFRPRRRNRCAACCHGIAVFGRDSLLLGGVLVEPTPALAPKPARMDHGAQQWTWPEFGIAQLLVQHIHDVHA